MIVGHNHRGQREESRKLGEFQRGTTFMEIREYRKIYPLERHQERNNRGIGTYQIIFQ